jgi:hypothetical protein
VPDIQDLRRKYSDWLLTLLTALLVLMIFVFAPLQGMGIFAFQGFAIAGLLVLIGGVMILSANRIALALICVGVVANVAVFVLRLFQPPWSYNLHLLAAAWLIIAMTLGRSSPARCSDEAASLITGLSERFFCICSLR